MTKKILIVEDEKPLAKILKYNLEKEGYSVLSAYDGESGLSFVNEEKPAGNYEVGFSVSGRPVSGIQHPASISISSR